MAVDHLIKRQNVQSTKVTMKITPTATILLISGFLSTSFARSIVDHDEDDHALRRLSSSGKGGSSNNDGRRNARRICKWLLQFDADGRGYGNDPTIPGFEWDSCCDVVANKQHKLCPKPAVVDEICAHKNWHLNPATNQAYCNPLVSKIRNAELRAQCKTACTNYVSYDRGNCCSLEETCDA